MHQQRFAGAKNAGSWTAGQSLRGWMGVDFIHEIREMDEICFRFAQGNVKVSCLHDALKDRMSPPIKAVEILGGVDGFRDLVNGLLDPFLAATLLDLGFK